MPSSSSSIMATRCLLRKGSLLILTTTICVIFRAASAFTQNSHSSVLRLDAPRSRWRPRKANFKDVRLCSTTRDGGLPDILENNNRTFPAVRTDDATAASSLGIASTIVGLSDDTEDFDDTVSAEEKSTGIRSWLQNSLFLGIDPSPEIIAICTIYFVEGALGLSRLAQTYLLKDELHLGPAELAALSGIFSLPWTIKPVYGFISDSIPLFGSKRRSYLILCGLLGSLSYIALGSDFGGALQGTSFALPGTVASLLLSSACIAFSDVVADGIVVQRTRDTTDPSIAGGLQSLCWGFAAMGGLISAYWSGSLLEVLSLRTVFTATAVLPLLVTIIALLIDESSVESSAGTDDGPNVMEQAQSLWNAIREPSIMRPALFIFLWQSTPTSDGAFFYFMSNDLHFGPEFMGRVRLISSAAGLLGVWIYQKYLRTVAIKDILFWSSIIATPLGLSSLLLITHANRDLGIPDGAFVFGDDVALAILGEIAFLPTLVLAAKICPKGIEALLFATLMSINNAASTIGTELGALLTKWVGVTEDNFDNLAFLTILCNLSSLYPLLFIGWLDGAGEKSEAELDQEGSD